MPAILLTGASGTGKTTLARAVALQLGFEFLPSSVAAVYAEAGTTFAAVKDDSERLAEMQYRIAFRHLSEINERLAGGVPFVSDRGLDSVVYTAHLCRGAFAAGRMRRVAEKFFSAIKRPDVLNVLVPLRAAISVAARSDPDERRAEFLDDRTAYTIEGATVFALESHNVPYRLLIEDEISERVSSLVDYVRSRKVLNARV